MTRSLFIIFLLLLAPCVIIAQKQETERFFQVSGIISDEDKIPLSNVGVVSLKLRRGTLSGKNGIYSITSTPGDTIFFRALGFKRKLMIMPSDFEGRHLSLDVSLTLDTIPIENVVVMPWKNYNDFIKDMTEPSPVSPEIENMNKNIESVAEAISSLKGVKITPEAGYRYAMQQNFNMAATRNQYPVNNLLNPFAWAKFISGIKEGLLKNQESTKPAKTKAKNRKKRRER